MDNSSENLDRARVKRPERLQEEWRPFALDSLLPSDHQARAVWAYVDSLDLGLIYAKIRAVKGKAGRDAVDPKILMALWMFAIIEGISSGRQLDRLCTRDLAFMWICGGVGVNYHMLCDFRTEHGDFLAQLLSDTIATLMHQGLVTLNVVAQDGMRVRANAGSSSFRRRGTLEKCQQDAARQVQALQEESESEQEQGNSDARRKAAQERAATERAELVKEALKNLTELEQQKEKREKGSGVKARCSTTDPEARKMKMGDGGYRPAYNVQFASDGEARIIVGVRATNLGSDRGEMAKMHEDISEAYGKAPEAILVDCGFNTREDVKTVEQSGSKVYAPIYEENAIRERGNDPYARKKGDSDEMFAFRQRMATDEAKELYKQRPSIAEFPNAECRNRGLTQFRVRGLAKIKTYSLWYAITFNFMRMTHLGFI